MPSLAATFVSLVTVAATSLAGAQPLPEYRFTTGEALTYELTSKEDLLEREEDSTRRYEKKLRWNVYPIRQNQDGSWRIVVGTKVQMLRFDRDEDGDEQKHVRFENEFLSYCDLRPDGTYVENPTLQASFLFGLSPQMIFTPLVEGGWTTPVGDGTYTIQSVAPASQSTTIVVAIEHPSDANYQSTSTREITFDVAAGRATEFQTTDIADWTTNPWHVRKTYQLTEVETHSPTWLAEFVAETDAYFATHQTWWQTLVLRAPKVRTAAACRAILDEVRTSIEQAKKTATLPEVQSAYAGMLALHDRDSKWALEEVERREALFEAPAADWESVNLTGEPRRLVDYRGEVLILDFWYRGCGHCILALPKIKQLHAKYKDRGATVLGISKDRDLADAEHVVREFAIPYESIRARGSDDKPIEPTIDQRYQVDTWPTFVVLDQHGRVAEVVSGNAQDLVEHLSSVVDGLLAGKSGRESSELP